LHTTHPFQETSAMIHRVFRTSLALIVGLFAISMFVESLEFVIVAIANGRVTTDPDVYLAIRNQTWILITKLMYNAVGAVAGGYIAGRLARYAYRNHGIALAAIQSLAFVWALTQPEIRNSTPGWMWALLIPLTAAGIVVGASLCAQQKYNTSDVGNIPEFQ
jgi:hypothetical protein